MNLKERIETALAGQDVVVVNNKTETPTGRAMDNYVVNKHGVVLQFSIPEDNTDEGVVEDFIQYIVAQVKDVG